jgi:hypothetical protein
MANPHRPFVECRDADVKFLLNVYTSDHVFCGMASLVRIGPNASLYVVTANHVLKAAQSCDGNIKFGKFIQGKVVYYNVVVKPIVARRVAGADQVYLKPPSNLQSVLGLRPIEYRMAPEHHQVKVFTPHTDKNNYSHSLSLMEMKAGLCCGYAASTLPGTSGSPIVWKRRLTQYVCGIHTFGSSSGGEVTNHGMLLLPWRDSAEASLETTQQDTAAMRRDAALDDGDFGYIDSYDDGGAATYVVRGRRYNYVASGDPYADVERWNAEYGRQKDAFDPRVVEIMQDDFLDAVYKTGKYRPTARGVVAKESRVPGMSGTLFDGSKVIPIGDREQDFLCGRLKTLVPRPEGKPQFNLEKAISQPHKVEQSGQTGSSESVTPSASLKRTETPPATSDKKKRRSKRSTRSSTSATVITAASTQSAKQVSSNVCETATQTD